MSDKQNLYFFYGWYGWQDLWIKSRGRSTMFIQLQNTIILTGSGRIDFDIV